MIRIFHLQWFRRCGHLRKSPFSYQPPAVRTRSPLQLLRERRLDPSVMPPAINGEWFRSLHRTGCFNKQFTSAGWLVLESRKAERFESQPAAIGRSDVLALV